ncbi:MAG: hypothetical protein JJT82_08010 [Legionellaceae bacterium]|nr:hypothetical protein [Legionellaceae bacterium]
MTLSLLLNLDIKPRLSAFSLRLFSFIHIGSFIVTAMSPLDWPVKLLLLSGLVLSFFRSLQVWRQGEEPLSFYHGQWFLGHEEAQTGLKELSIGFSCPWFMVLRVLRSRLYEKKWYFYDQLQPEEWHQLHVLLHAKSPCAE